MNMIPTIQAERPPYVHFEAREHGVDAEATEATGHTVPRMVHFACITPHGSKDIVEKVAEEWLAQIQRLAIQGAYNPEWVKHFKSAFEEYKKGNELPREGTPVLTWQLGTTQSRKRLHELGITTVEDLAATPDTTLAMIGLDGRYLRDTARAWIAEGKEKGITAKALADANARIDDLVRINSEQVARIEKLENKLVAIATREPEDDQPEVAPRGKRKGEPVAEVGT